MTSSGTGAGGGRQDWPFGPVNGDADAAPRTTAPRTTASSGAPARPGTASSSAGGARPTGTEPTASPKGRRPPVWVLVLLGLVVVGAVVAAVLLLNGRDGGQAAAPDPEVVTLPLPTPTVQPIPREGATAFASALPSTVLAYALAEAGEHPPFLTAGALEAYRYVYTDGATSVVLLAGQWETPEEASAAYAATVQAQTGAVAATGAGDAGDGEEEDADTSTDTEEGAVTTTDGTETGRWTLVPRGDGTATLTWWNGTAMLQLDGPVDVVPDLFAAFTL